MDMVITGPGGRDPQELEKLIAEAMEVAPPGYQQPGAELLPRHKGTGGAACAARSGR